MDPHNNPVYKHRLLNFFTDDERIGKLKINYDDELDKTYDAMERSVTFKQLGILISGIIGTYAADKYYFKLPKDNFRKRTSLYTVGSCVIYLLHKWVWGGRYNMDLRWKMAFKYENVLITMHPELKIYHEEEKKPNLDLTSWDIEKGKDHTFRNVDYNYSNNFAPKNKNPNFPTQFAGLDAHPEVPFDTYDPKKANGELQYGKFPIEETWHTRQVKNRNSQSNQDRPEYATSPYPGVGESKNQGNL